MMEEEERKCKEEKRKVDSSKTILRKEKGLVSSVMIKEMLIHVLKKKICNVFQFPMQKVRSSGSYPDLLEMVTRSGSPSSRDHAGMYAKVGGMSMYDKCMRECIPR